jgi:hypothetical protein
MSEIDLQAVGLHVVDPVPDARIGGEKTAAVGPLLPMRCISQPRRRSRSWRC